jgi:hypothetical protein
MNDLLADRLTDIFIYYDLFNDCVKLLAYADDVNIL